MTTFPLSPSPRLALHSQPAAVARSSAPRNPTFAQREGITAVRGLRPLRVNDSLPPWGGPAEAAHG